MTGVFQISTNILQGLGSLSVAIISGIFNILGNLLNLIMRLSSNSILLIYNVVIVVITSLILIAKKVWNGIGTFFGLILDILYLLYEAIFSNISPS
jgi:hypothetical protein